MKETIDDQFDDNTNKKYLKQTIIGLSLVAASVLPLIATDSYIRNDNTRKYAVPMTVELPEGLINLNSGGCFGYWGSNNKPLVSTKIKYRFDASALFGEPTLYERIRDTIDKFWSNLFR